MNFQQKSNQRRGESILNIEFKLETFFADCSHNRTVYKPVIFEDSDKDQKNRFLMVNMYQNGTVMV